MPTLQQARDAGRAAFRKPVPLYTAHGWHHWVTTRHPQYCAFDFGERHRRLWEWFESLERGVKPAARVEVWPRGGAKSTSGELGTAYIGEKGTRKFVLYVSETQDQADKHVQTIASLLESDGIGAGVNKAGHSKGWRRDQLRADNGFNVAAIGVDTAARGIKLDEFRPDLIVFDDIDGLNDGAAATQKKIDAITNTLIPAGSGDCAVLFLQNLIIETGIVSQLVSGEAKFLFRRDVPPIEPAAWGLTFEPYKDDGGYDRYRVVTGTPTWAGQDLAKIESQLEDWGPAAFLREAQHEVRGANGFVFDVAKIREGAPPSPILRTCLAMDLAGTENGGDWTVFGLFAALADGSTWLLDLKRIRKEPNGVARDLERFALDAIEVYPQTRILVLQDPAQAGKYQSVRIIEDLEEAGVPRSNLQTIRPRGSKAVRARGAAEDVNAGKTGMVVAAWNREHKAVLGAFREDGKHLIDDDVDVWSDAHTYFWKNPGSDHEEPINDLARRAEAELRRYSAPDLDGEYDF